MIANCTPSSNVLQNSYLDITDFGLACNDAGVDEVVITLNVFNSTTGSGTTKDYECYLILNNNIITANVADLSNHSNTDTTEKVYTFDSNVFTKSQIEDASFGFRYKPVSSEASGGKDVYVGNVRLLTYNNAEATTVYVGKYEQPTEISNIVNERKHISLIKRCISGYQYFTNKAISKLIIVLSRQLSIINKFISKTLTTYISSISSLIAELTAQLYEVLLECTVKANSYKTSFISKVQYLFTNPSSFLDKTTNKNLNTATSSDDSINKSIDKNITSSESISSLKQSFIQKFQNNNINSSSFKESLIDRTLKINANIDARLNKFNRMILNVQLEILTFKEKLVSKFLTSVTDITTFFSRSSLYDLILECSVYVQATKQRFVDKVINAFVEISNLVFFVKSLANRIFVPLQRTFIAFRRDKTLKAEKRNDVEIINKRDTTYTVKKR